MICVNGRLSFFSISRMMPFDRDCATCADAGTTVEIQSKESKVFPADTVAPVRALRLAIRFNRLFN